MASTYLAGARQRIETAKEKVRNLKNEIQKLRSEKSAKAQHASLPSYLESCNLPPNNQKNLTLPQKNKSKQQRCSLQRLLRGHFGKVYALHWGSVDHGDGDSKNLISASQDGKLIVWNAHTKNKLHAIPLRSTWVMTCAYEPTRGELVACGGLDNVCSVYKLAIQSSPSMTPQPVMLNGHEGYLACCRFLSPERILTCSGDSTCLLWDITKQRSIARFSDHTGDVMSVSLNPKDPNIFVSGSCDASAKVWDIRVAKCVKSFGEATLGDSTGGVSGNKVNEFAHSSDINSVDFLMNGYSFATGSDDSTSRIFDIRSYTQMNMFKQTGKMCVTSVAVSKQGRLLFCGYDGTDQDSKCLAWDTLKKNEKWAELTGHTTRVSCLGLDVTGTALATGSWDTQIRIFA